MINFLFVSQLFVVTTLWRQKMEKFQICRIMSVATDQGDAILFASNQKWNSKPVFFFAEEEKDFWSMFAKARIEIKREVHSKYGKCYRFNLLDLGDGLVSSISSRGILIHRPNNTGDCYLAHSSNCLIPFVLDDYREAIKNVLLARKERDFLFRTYPEIAGVLWERDFSELQVVRGSQEYFAAEVAIIKEALGNALI